MPFYLFRDLLVRVFYGIEDAKTPFRISTIAILLNLFFDWFLIGGTSPWGELSPLNLGVNGLVFSTTFVNFFACIFLFLIGASLGAIIKKGGLGLPMVLSVLIFLSYHYIGIFGKNAAEDNSIPPYLASWISTIIIAPFAFYLTRRASYDEGFVNLDFLFIPLKHFFKKISSSK